MRAHAASHAALDSSSSEEHSAKTSFPISVTESGSMIEVREEQPAKALFPIVVTESGSVTNIGIAGARRRAAWLRLSSRMSEYSGVRPPRLLTSFERRCVRSPSTGSQRERRRLSSFGVPPSVRGDVVGDFIRQGSFLFGVETRILLFLSHLFQLYRRRRERIFVVKRIATSTVTRAHRSQLHQLVLSFSVSV